MKLALHVAVIAAPLCFAAAASGQNPSQNAMTNINGATGRLATTGVAGWSFIPTTDLVVTHLGRNDCCAPGLTGSYRVGLFRRADAVMLAEVDVGNNGGVFGDSRMLAIQPLVLQGGVQYYLMMEDAHTNDFVFSQVASIGLFVDFADEINWTGTMFTTGADSITDPYVSDPSKEPIFGANFRFQVAGDCNGNGNADLDDIASGEESDCNLNLVPDSCELETGDTDCNVNGVLDSCDIAADPFLDFDDNGLIDACADCIGDVDFNGSVNVADLLGLLSSWDGCAPECTNRNHRSVCPADGNGDCTVDVSDLLNMLATWGPCF